MLSSKAVTLIFLSAFFLSSLIYPEGDKKSISKTAYTRQYSQFNANNVSTYISNIGYMDNNMVTGNSGMEYPNDSKNGVIFMSGLMWGGLINTEIRIGGSFYSSGLFPGSIRDNGQPEDPNSPSVRVYRVRKDYKTGDLANELANDVDKNYDSKTYKEIFLQYEKDWNEWPAEKGAPYEDIDGNGKYNPDIDIPGEPGALQTLWYSANDINAPHDFYMGKSTQGIELQATIWGYDYHGAIENTIFRRYILINKSRDTLKNAYISLFADPDLGNASDDLAGCDTSVNLIYCYNSDNYDEGSGGYGGYGDYPPAVGFLLLQGPIVEGSSNDKAIFKGREISGMKNLPITSSTFVLKYGADEGDFNYSNPQEVYNYMRGFHSNGEPIYLPERFGGGITKFLFSGDIGTGEGWIDGIEYRPADRRTSASSGPFTFAPADTQEVIYACIAAGHVDGLSNIEAVSELKLYAKNIKNVFRKMNVINQIAGPATEVFEGDHKITLTWGKNNDIINSIENFENSGVKFEGYNIYQAPSLNPDSDEIVKIAEYDLNNGIKEVRQPYMAPGMLIPTVGIVQYGTDIGIKRHIIIGRDSLHNIYLRNGSKYYFAVTAYYVDENNPYYPYYESSLKFIEVIPQIEKPGVRYGGKPGDELAIEHTAGGSENAPVVTVVHPANLNGHDYEITFNAEEGDSVSAILTDITADKQYAVPVFPDEKTPGIDINGLNISIIEDDHLRGVKDVNDLTPYINLYPASSYQFRLEEFFGSMGWSSPRQMFGDGKPGVPPRYLKKVELRFPDIQDTNKLNPQFDLSNPDISFAYRYGRNFDKAPARPEFVPFIINQGEGFAYQGYEKSVPFSAWDVEDSLNPRRLAIAHMENNVVNGLVDGKYWPQSYRSNTADTTPCEWVWILNEDYSETPNSAYAGNAIALDIPAMYMITAVRRHNYYGFLKDVMTIIPYKLLSENDVYAFTSPGNTYNLETAKADVDKINVFPNPYYCNNPQETRQYESFVTFNNLPQKAIIRIFNIGGQLVRTLYKDSPSIYFQWDLRTDSNYQAGSGMYIALIEMPELGKTKTLKLAIIQRQYIPDRF